MKLFECRRNPEENIDSWMGALLIFADTPEEAEIIFQESERGHKPERIIERKIERGVIYDDYMR